MNRVFITALFVMLLYSNIHSQNGEDSTRVDPFKLAVVSGATAGVFVYGYVIQNNIWWKGKKSEFHFNNTQDYKYAINADKLGHFHFAYLNSKIYGGVLQWVGFSKLSAQWYASGLALAFQTFTEIRDGFSQDYGFSWGDMAANTLGALYPVSQNYYPALKYINFKVSFNPSQAYKAEKYSHIMDDYESTYYWLSADINKLVSESVEKYIPDFINLALGASVTNLDRRGNGSYELFIGLDWNFEALPGDGWFWSLLKKSLNFYRLPAPVIKIAPNVVWYGFKF